MATVPVSSKSARLQIGRGDVRRLAFEIEYRRGVVNRISFARLIYFNIRLPWFSQALFKIYNELAIIILFVPLLLFNWIVRTYDT